MLQLLLGCAQDAVQVRGCPASRLADGAGAAFLGQEHVRLDIADTGKSHDPAAQHALEVRDIACHDAQAVIVKAEDMLDRLNLGDGRDRAFEILKTDAVLGGELHAEKDGDAKAQLFVIEIKALRLDDAAVVKLAHAPPRGGLRETKTAA